MKKGNSAWKSLNQRITNAVIRSYDSPCHAESRSGHSV